MKTLLHQCGVFAAMLVVGCALQTGGSESSAGIGVQVAVEAPADGGVTEMDDALCGNEIVDEGETCDVGIPIPEQGCCPFPEFCVDDDPCTVDKIARDGTCQAVCDFGEHVQPSGTVRDACCPDGATSVTDADCEAGPVEPPMIDGQAFACSVPGLNARATLPVVLTAAEASALQAGQPGEIQVTTHVVMTERFVRLLLESGVESLGFLGISLRVRVRSGAGTASRSIGNQITTPIDLRADPDNNGQPGPILVEAGTGILDVTPENGSTEVLLEVEWASMNAAVSPVSNTTLECSPGTWTFGPAPTFAETPPVIVLTDDDAVSVPVN